MMRLITLLALLVLPACTYAGLRPWEIFTGSLPRDATQFLDPPMDASEVSLGVINACRASIAAQAEPLGATRVEAASAGTSVTLPSGLTETPIAVKITYEQEDQVQVREARVACRMNDQGGVVELM